MATLFTIILTLVSLCLNCYGQRSSLAVEKRVAVLIEKMLNTSTEQQALADLEALGCPAVPAIVERMDDRRNLPDPRISL
jgi:hypothetical protein